ncbi:hypothetical protein [uncultured Shewanella sp.]|uniref:hypothetical protein n=1 Tax=uncultured Shewanella sp. TaxID=173975 RepID=UPI0026353A5A|nr:hypothetical protein [uncultured Shewanella sp.]
MLVLVSFLMFLVNIYIFKMLKDFFKGNAFVLYNQPFNAHSLIMDRKGINLMPESKVKLKSINRWKRNIEDYINKYD